MPDYSVVIVARDHARNLLNTLVALRQRAHPREVLVVDNASSSDLRAVLALSQLPIRHVRLSEHHQSLGAAYNTGIDAAASDNILLMHCDVLLETDPGIGVEFLDEHPDVGIVGAKLFAYEAPPRRLLHAGFSVARGRIGPTQIGRYQWDRFHEIADVAAVSDACMLLRRTELRFDERFWFRLQDVDLCHQYRQHGYRVAFLPDVQAVHVENGGVIERSADLTWAARQLASQLLYHERWCSDAALDVHPRQIAVRGAAAVEYLQKIDASYGVDNLVASAVGMP
jgi:GT2 family glycosyltransferase